MKLRAQKRCLVLATGLCLLAVPVVLAWGLRPPEPAASPGQHGATSATAVRPGADMDSLTMRIATDEDASVWNKRLRRPLYDPPPPKPVKRTPPPLRVALMGTIVEPGNSMAIVSTRGGAVEYKRVGDSVGPEANPAELVEILGDAIVVRRDDETLTLRVGEER